MFRRKYWKIDSFAVPIEKEVTRSDRNGEEITKNVSYVLQLIDSARFMTSSLSNLINNLSDGIHRTKCKLGHDDKKRETCAINIIIVTVLLNIQILKMIYQNTNFCVVIKVINETLTKS